jgi:hypothetical protein
MTYQATVDAALLMAAIDACLVFVVALIVLRAP